MFFVCFGVRAAYLGAYIGGCVVVMRVCDVCILF